MEDKLKKQASSSSSSAAAIQDIKAALSRLSPENQQKIMMLRAHGLLDDSELVDFVRMASATGPGGASALL